MIYAVHEWLRLPNPRARGALAWQSQLFAFQAALRHSVLQCGYGSARDPSGAACAARPARGVAAHLVRGTRAAAATGQAGSPVDPGRACRDLRANVRSAEGAARG